MHPTGGTDEYHMSHQSIIIIFCFVIYNDEHMYVYMATLKPVDEWQYKLCEATHHIAGTVCICRAPQYTVGRMPTAIRIHLLIITT
jgi:hypothetical protein